MPNSVHYILRTTSLTNNTVNAEVIYDVYYSTSQGIAYQVELKVPAAELGGQLSTVWYAKIVNDTRERRFEYDILKKIYYQTRQTIMVEAALYNLEKDLKKFLASNKLKPAQDQVISGSAFPGKTLNTLTIWYDPARSLPVRRVNQDRGNMIIDEFFYYSIDETLPAVVFNLPKPAEAVADFNLYPEAPTLPRFEMVSEAEKPQYGVYVNTLLTEIKRHVILNQWEYGPFSTIKLPWLTKMPVIIYRRKNENIFPPLIVIFEVPRQGNTYFFINYSYLGYVVTGFTQNPYELSGYEELPIKTSVTLKDLVPLYASPSYEKKEVVSNFVKSVQSNDFFINAFDMGGKYFDLIIKNFSFHENEGYLLLNVYGKEYWDSANLEAKFNYIVSGQLADAHTTPIIIYALNALKRLGIYRNILMPSFKEVPG